MPLVITKDFSPQTSLYENLQTFSVHVIWHLAFSTTTFVYLKKKKNHNFQMPSVMDEQTDVCWVGLCITVL